MAIAVNIDQRRPQRVGLHLRMLTGTFDLDNSYPTGGYDLSALSNRFKTLHRLTTDQAGGYLFQFDKANNKLKVFYPTKSVAAHSHTAMTVNATEAAADSTTFVSVTGGDGTAHSDVGVSNAGGAANNIDILTSSDGAISAGAGVEVANGVDLSGVVGVSFVAIGR